MTDAEFDAAIQRIDASLQRTREAMQRMKNRDKIAADGMNDGGYSEFDTTMRRLDASLQGTDEAMERVKDRDNIAVDGMNDGGYFVGSLWAWERSARHSPVFAHRLNLEYRRNVPTQELGDMIMSQDTSDVSPLDLSSFYHTRVVVEAEDKDGQLHYIAVIVVFVALEADGIWAIRCAELLSRFTGRPAHAVVASMQAHKEFRGLASSEPVHWVCLDKRARTN